MKVMKICKHSGNVDPLIVMRMLGGGEAISRLCAILFRESLGMLVTKG